MVEDHNNCHNFVDLEDVDRSRDSLDLAAHMEAELPLEEEGMHLVEAVDNDEVAEDIDLLEIKILIKFQLLICLYKPGGP